jgi:Chaperone for flagella basal body P-ring formation
MKRFALAMAAVSGAFALAILPCVAETTCSKVAVESSVEVGPGELTLADLLTQGAYPELRQAAAQVHLGNVPRPGSVRVLDGQQVRFLLAGLADGKAQDARKAACMRIPERVVVRRAGAKKTCAAIAKFLASAAPSDDIAGASRARQENLDCAAARSIPETAPLELTRTTRNAALQRWEFALRCARPEDCAPFLVWTREEEKSLTRLADAQSGSSQRAMQLAGSHSQTPEEAGSTAAARLVKPGQTAILTWDQAGIRVVLPVTCLDAGGLGQFVRVRLKNAARTLRAEVVGEAILRASL